MTPASSSTAANRADPLRAIDFALQCFEQWHARGLIRDDRYQAIQTNYHDLRTSLEQGGQAPGGLVLRPADRCWSCKQPVGEREKGCAACGAPMGTADADRLRYLIFVCFEIKRHQKEGRLGAAAGDQCLAEANQRVAALRRKLDRERIPFAEAVPAGAAEAPEIAEVLPADLEPRPRPAPPTPRRPVPVAEVAQRSLMEIVLDPRAIQWLLASGGALLVLGLVIWLAAEGIFENKLFLAIAMGAGNLALLVGGWAVIGYTRHEIAGRALTLLACLLMPLNLWFYNAQGLITLQEGGHLWVPAVVCCALYAISARLLRDPTFVYVLVAGVALTGLLILADQDFQRFWEIAAPSTLLVALGVVCIHAERIFSDDEGPFSRRRFGLAFFWSGHVLLAAGLLLLLGAQLSGDWLYPFFEPLYRAFDAGPPQIVTDAGGKLLALCLVLVGTYVYAYSDLVVRRSGVYVYIAVFALLWAEVLVLNMFPWPLPKMEVVIIALAATALLANLTLAAAAGKDSALMRAGPPLGLFLSVLPVVLGVLLHFWGTARLTSYRLTETYVIAMLATAISCRVGAFVYRHSHPGLSTTYFFGTAAATLAGAAGLLVALQPALGWEDQAPLLMLIPIAYVVAARLYRGHSPEKPLILVAHVATAVMLFSSLGASVKGFALVEGERLNLMLALFFAEAALFYLLEAGWARQQASVYAATAMACAAAWQVLKYASVADEYFVLTFAAVGLLLLLAYRFAVLERGDRTALARGAFQSGNVLLSLALVSGALMTLSELLTRQATREVLLPLLSALGLISLAAVALLRQAAWRRWYAAMAITDASLVVLVLAVLGHLTPGQKLEIVCVVIGLLLLLAGHIGWYREQEGQNDLVTLSLFFGSFLVAVPLTVAVVWCRAVRSDDLFHTINEVGALAAGLVLLAVGFICQVKSTTLAGAVSMILYVVSLLLYVRLPEQLQTTAVYMMVGGGLFFAVGLLLSLYRDRLLSLPDRIKRREGVFRVLTWR